MPDLSQNPILKYKTYTIKNVLMGFTTTDDAIKTKIDYSVGKCGTILKGAGCGKDGVVIVNEFADPKFTIIAHRNEFEYSSAIERTSTSMTGAITIVDSIGGLFQNFMKTEVSDKLGVSQTHVIYVLKTFIIGSIEDGTKEIISVKPLIFHMYSLGHNLNDESSPNNTYVLMYLADYNTFALLPNYSRLYQLTITHKDSGTASNFANMEVGNFVIPPPTTPTATIKVTPNITVTPPATLTPTPTPTGGVEPNQLSVSDNGIDFLKSHEGLSLEAYWDVNAYAIGYAHRKGVKQGDTCTPEQAEQFLREDLTWCEDAIHTKVKVLLNQGMYDALTSLTYNVGASGYNRLLSLLNQGDYSGAQNAFNLYIYSGGKVNQVLANRRAQEAAMFGGLPPPSGDVQIPDEDALVNTHKQDIINQRNRQRALNSNRTARLDNNKTMYNLKDVMEGFEYSLKQLSKPPQSNLSRWLGNINDGYVSPLLPDNQRKSGGILPIDYTIQLDTKYYDYPIDNRNLIFEQPSQSQLSPGIKVYQVSPGKLLPKTVLNLMKLSSKVGHDMGPEETLAKAFKCNISTVKTCNDKYHFDVQITKYTVPHNDDKINTGPGNGESFYKPLIYNYQLSSRNRDIIKMFMTLNSTNSLEPLSSPLNSNDNKVVYGNREQIMMERSPDVDFFNTAFSGVRAMGDPVNFGLENSNSSMNINNNERLNSKQNTRVNVTIVGNPSLLSDIFRDPQKVMNNDADNPNFYKFPEKYPMYAKMNVYIKPASTVGIKVNKDVPRMYHYTNYYHLGKITTNIVGSLFTQELELFRMDAAT